MCVLVVVCDISDILVLLVSLCFFFFFAFLLDYMKKGSFLYAAQHCLISLSFLALSSCTPYFLLSSSSSPFIQPVSGDHQASSVSQPKSTEKCVHSKKLCTYLLKLGLGVITPPWLVFNTYCFVVLLIKGDRTSCLECDCTSRGDLFTISSQTHNDDVIV